MKKIFINLFLFSLLLLTGCNKSTENNTIENREVTPLLGELFTEGLIPEILISKDNKIAYIVESNRFIIVNIENDNPQIISDYINDEYDIRDIELSEKDNRIYLCTSAEDLSVIDISDIYSPKKVKSLELIGLTNNFVLSSDGSKAYLSSVRGADSILRVIDLKNDKLEELSSLRIEYGASRDIILSPDDTTIYLTSDDFGLFVLNVKDSENISLLNRQSFLDVRAWNISISNNGDYVYLSGSYNGFKIIDVRDPYDLIALGHYSTRDIPNKTRFGHVTEMIVSNDNSKIYIVNNIDGFEIIDIKDTSSPQLIKNYFVENSAIGLAITKDNKKAYVAHRNGFFILDLDVLK